MLRFLLLFTLICTCGPAQIRAQFTFSINTGYSFGSFNQQPELTGDISFVDQGGHLKALNSPTVGLEINYAPATKVIFGGLQVTYSRRGHEHLLRRMNGELEQGFSFPFHVDYLDIASRLIYRPGRLLSASIGPYISLGRKFEDNPFIVESERRTTTLDYGIKVEGRVHFSRTYVFTSYQRSMRDFDYPDLIGSQSGDIFLSNEQPSPISAFQVGIGYTIIR